MDEAITCGEGDLPACINVGVVCIACDCDAMSIGDAPGTCIGDEGTLFCCTFAGVVCIPGTCACWAVCIFPIGICCTCCIPGI